jgi:CHAT domain-containing protein
VWWVGSGLLNLLPIHAAGYHGKPGIRGTNQSVIDRVISSYAPTLKALAYARERQARVASIDLQSCLLVGMPETPNETSLPFVEQEMQKIQDLLKASSHISTINLQSPTREEVLAIMSAQNVVHFSCHGCYSEELDPSSSKILLSDWTTNPLTVSDITSLNCQSSQFAFLSACHTAGSRDIDLLDESINLTSAMQLAGFHSVIGTLWQVRDEQSANVAEKVYGWMLTNGERLAIELSAEALHHAVRGLRDSERSVPNFSKKATNSPLIWASYIHAGV